MKKSKKETKTNKNKHTNIVLERVVFNESALARMISTVDKTKTNRRCFEIIKIISHKHTRAHNRKNIVYSFSISLYLYISQPSLVHMHEYTR